MTSLKLLDTQRLIWSPFRSFRAIQDKWRQNYLYYKHATILKFAQSSFGTQFDTVYHGVKFLEGFWVLVTPHLPQLPTVHVTKCVLITYGLVQHKTVSA